MFDVEQKARNTVDEMAWKGVGMSSWKQLTDGMGCMAWKSIALHWHSRHLAKVWAKVAGRIQQERRYLI